MFDGVQRCAATQQGGTIVSVTLDRAPICPRGSGGVEQEALTLRDWRGCVRAQRVATVTGVPWQCSDALAPRLPFLTPQRCPQARRAMELRLQPHL